MADAQTALRAAIAADAGIIAILGSPADARIFAPVLPPGTDVSTTPAVTIHQVLLAHLGDRIEGPQTSPMHRFQVSSIAEKRSDAQSLSGALVTALDALTGTFDTIPIQVIRFVAGTGPEEYEPLTQTTRILTDFEVQL